MKSNTLRRVMRPLRPEPLTEVRSSRYSAASRRTAGDKRISPRGAACALEAGRVGESFAARGVYCSAAPLIEGGIAAYQPGAGASAVDAAAAGRAGAVAGAGAGAAALAGGGCALAPAALSITARTVPTSTVVPAGTRILVITPAVSDGTSIETLSVSTSNRISSTATVSPTFLCQFATVPSATVSPSCGINTSIGASSVLCATC